jgi:putative colanic acid biosynthesis UDP-glucose lipid carrier transferase
VPVISVFDSPFQGVDGSLKRAEDLVLGILALLIAAIPMIIVAILIKSTTRGPVLFRQRRYGLGGREIGVFKFRSMTVSEDGARVVRATQNDQRVTKIGAIMRRTSIDELPQLFNVIGGSMSLVGPRPHAVAHNEQYRSLVSNYMLRHKVKPGITGWAQVNGLRGETDTTEKMQKRVEYDLYYINNWSLALDIRIMWMTVFGSRTRKNAF